MKITYLNETSMHMYDGYCSGAECDYECETAVQYVPVPPQYEKFPLGIITNWKQFDWKSLLEKPYFERGSMYCELSAESESHGLGCHDYRHTIIFLEIVERAPA